MDYLNKNSEINIYVVSDSAGQTGLNLARASLSQFPSLASSIQNVPFITEKKQIQSLFHQFEKSNAVFIYSFAEKELGEYFKSMAKENEIKAYDFLSPFISIIEEHSHLTSKENPGALHQLDEEYFNRIKAMEFAVKYDDGKDPKGFLEADILLLGISRTSKTPLSIFLANENYKVANLPILPESQLPDELWEVDSRKIIGLTNSKSFLHNIRKERLKSYGMNPDAKYSSCDRIEQEIAYANQLYEELNCYVINVENKSIEETTALIIDYLKDKHSTHPSNKKPR